MANFHLACHCFNSEKTCRDYACTHTHECAQGHTYRTHPQITVWLTKQEVGKPTQSDRCQGDGQWERGVNEGVSGLSSQVGLSVTLMSA